MKMELERQRSELIQLISKAQNLQLLEHLMHLLKSEFLEDEWVQSKEFKTMLDERERSRNDGSAQSYSWDEVLKYGKS